MIRIPPVSGAAAGSACMQVLLGSGVMLLATLVPLHGAETAPPASEPGAPGGTAAVSPPRVIIPELPAIDLPALAELPPAVQARLQSQAEAASARALANARERAARGAAPLLANGDLAKTAVPGPRPATPSGQSGPTVAVPGVSSPPTNPNNPATTSDK